ncbi:MAG: FecR domain-containing protein [Acidimicrobiia bacterium]
MVVAVTTLIVLVGAGLWWAADRGGSAAEPSLAAAQASTTPLAKLHIIRPAVELRAKGNTEFRAARDGATLRQGDALRTDAAGFVEVEYADGSLTRLGPSTEFSIARLTEERGGRQTRGSITVGDTWNRAAKVTESGSFEMQSGRTTAAVEGTAFAFSCTAPGTCDITDVVDNVNVTTTTGQRAALTPATSIVAVNDVLSPATHLTREQMLANPFFVENLLLDLAAGKGLGLDDLPPAILGATVSNVGPLVITMVTPASPSVTTEAPEETTTTTTPPTTTTTVSPPTAPECVTEGWMRRVGSAGETFANEAACTTFALAGGTFATTGGGRFVIPRGVTVTFSDVRSDSACNALQYGYELDLDPATQTPVGARTPAPPACGGTFASTTIGPFPTARLLRVFLQDDSCFETRFFSDGYHARLDPSDPMTVWIMDAGPKIGEDLCPNVAVERRPPAVPPPGGRSVNLIVTVVIIDAPPTSG